MNGNRVERGSHVQKGYCRECGKFMYDTRKAAKKVFRAVHPGESMNAYRCPVRVDRWHVGHRPTDLAVLRGRE